MTDQYSGPLAFSKSDLEYFESGLQAEIATLTKRIEELQFQLDERRARIEKINKLRFSLGNSSSKIKEELVQTLRSILREAGEPMFQRNIVRRYAELAPGSAESRRIYECLQSYRGRYFGVVGERGAAKWVLITEESK